MADENQVAETVVEQSYLEMSDEELLNMPPPSGNVSGEEETPDEEPETPEAEEEVSESTEEASESDTQEDPEDDQAAEAVAEPAAKEEPTKSPQESSVDYKAEYEKVFAPFKANGKDFNVKSAEDAIALMQMGANYNKKMAALKPNLQLMKLLEKNGLLDESKLSYLIDLDKKNPDAINKLVKDSGIDPMDLDADKASGYKPNTYTVDEKEIELDTVLEDISSTSTYARTLDVVGNKWDGASKRTVAESPQILKLINDHMSSGVYDLISEELERERTFGRLNGLSDIEAYKQVGDAIQARKGFDHLFNNKGNQTNSPQVVTPKAKAEDDGKLRDKKRAASSTKPIAATSVPKDFNPLALSDEEFSKMGIAKFL